MCVATHSEPGDSDASKSGEVDSSLTGFDIAWSKAVGVGTNFADHKATGGGSVNVPEYYPLTAVGRDAVGEAPEAGLLALEALFGDCVHVHVWSDAT